MKRLLLAAIFCLCAVFAGACGGGGENDQEPQAPSSASAPPAAEPEGAPETATRGDENQLAALVNNVPITGRLLESQVVMAESGRLIFGDDLGEGEADDNDPEALKRREEADLALRREVLSGLISLELACQEAVSMGYAPADDEVEAALNEMRGDYEEPGQLHKALDQYGETEEELRAQLRKTMALKKWQDSEFLNKIEITEEEARAFYQANIETMRTEDGEIPFEEARGDIVEYLAEEDLTNAVRQRMLELEAAADIRILDPRLKEIMQNQKAAFSGENSPPGTDGQPNTSE